MLITIALPASRSMSSRSVARIRRDSMEDKDGRIESWSRLVSSSLLRCRGHEVELCSRGRFVALCLPPPVILCRSHALSGCSYCKPPFARPFIVDTRMPPESASSSSIHQSSVHSPPLLPLLPCISSIPLPPSPLRLYPLQLLILFLFDLWRRTT